MLFLSLPSSLILFSLSFSEMGLNLWLIILMLLFGGFFIISFFITSPNMDTKGLLRVLYSKPVRMRDGTVIYSREKE